MTVTVNLDDILLKFSVWSRYHAVASVCLTLVNVFQIISYNNYVFITEEVKYRCTNYSGHVNASNSSEIDGCAADSCSQWTYDDPHSFVAEFELACQEWKRTLVGSVHCFGCMLGLLIVGPLSDRLGRKTLTVTTCILGSVLGLMKSFMTNYWMYVAFEFLEAALGDPTSSSFTLCIEMIATEKRVLYTSISGFGYSIGGILYALILSQVPYWRNFLRIVYAPGLLFISYIYLIDESPRWLLTKGRKDQAVGLIESAAEINKMKLEDISSILYKEEKEEKFSKILLHTFKSPSLLLRFFVCVVWWVASTFVYHGLTINSVFLQGNKYVNFGLMYAVDMPVLVAVIFILKRFSRKMPLIFAFVACAVLCVAQPFVPAAYSTLSTVLYMSGKLMSSFYMSITYIFTSELFPTSTRNSMHALCSSVGRVGSIMAPQMPLLMMYWAALPALVFGLASLAAGLLTVLVPDTAAASLPDTVRQAEDIGKRGQDRRIDT